MARTIHDLFKRTLKKAKYTPLLDPLMESVTRKVLILIIGQIIHGIKHAHACKEESLEGLQLQGSSDWLLAGLWPYCSWPACCLCETPRLCQLEYYGSSSIQRSIKKKKKPRAHFLLVLSDVLLILQPQIWLLGDLLSYKLCCIPLTLHGTHLNKNKFYLHMNWQSIPWLIVLKQSETEKKK